MNDIPKTATVNIGCVGLVTISVYKEGYWNMVLDAKRDGKIYKCDLACTIGDGDYALEDGQFINVDDPLNPYIAKIEGWMWDCLMDKVSELNLAWVRNALDTPELKGVTV